MLELSDARGGMDLDLVTRVKPRATSGVVPIVRPGIGFLVAIAGHVSAVSPGKIIVSDRFRS